MTKEIVVNLMVWAWCAVMIWSIVRRRYGTIAVMCALMFVADGWWLWLLLTLLNGNVWATSRRRVRSRPNITFIMSRST